MSDKHGFQAEISKMAQLFQNLQCMAMLHATFVIVCPGEVSDSPKCHVVPGTQENSHPHLTDFYGKAEGDSLGN